MATVERLLQHGTQRGDRALRLVGEELRDKRLTVGLSQHEVAVALRVSRTTYTRIEGGQSPTLSIRRAAQVAAILGLDLSIRTYPGGNPLRDAAQAERLSRLLALVIAPLSYRTEVGLPQREGQPREQRAWDAMILGRGRRTGVEMEMRIRDAQALERRIDLKRRDDPVDNLVVLVADTRANRAVLRENPALCPRLVRLSLVAVARLLRDGQHPPSALVVI